MIKETTLKEIFKYKDGLLFWKQAGKGRSLNKPAGTMDKKGYIKVRFNNKQYYVHRLVFLMHHGYLPKEIDHIDGNKFNNKIENLRHATTSQNAMNRQKPRNNTSGYKGVSWDKKRNKWRTQIGFNGIQTTLGYYDCLVKAATAYKIEAEKLHKEFANAN